MDTKTNLSSSFPVSFKALKLISKRQKSGRLSPVFEPTPKEKQEAYIEKMIKIDKKFGRY